MGAPQSEASASPVEGEAKPGTMAEARPEPEPDRRSRAKLALAALGVVYGDIGTSPLYALRACFASPEVGPTPPNVLGVLSLVIWSLVLVIAIKYLLVVLRADDEGEGGVLALTVLAQGGRVASGKKRETVLLMLGVFGAALLYGDGMITPAISVLGAVEGLHLVAPSLGGIGFLVAMAILLALFLVQGRGTARVGAAFGPITGLWLIVLAGLGTAQIVAEPAVLRAVWPGYAVQFFAANGGHGFAVLGAVFLVVTGGEALYADLGHFGTRPIRWTWYGLVMPALLLVYLGQGALLLRHPGWIDDPFYRLAPHWALIPLLVLATAATIIASQAIITGAYSLSRQAMMLGLLPRMRLRHTSSKQFGQIYVPTVNWILMAATLALVAGFRSSAALAGAYGIAVSTTMVITTVLLVVALVRRFGWHPAVALALGLAFAPFDLAFFGANALKIGSGGWVPVAAAAVVFGTMATWRKGRAIVGARLRERMPSWDQLLERLRRDPPTTVPGTEVVLTSMHGIPPPHLVAEVERSGALRERVVLVTLYTERMARVPAGERLHVEHRGDRFVHVDGHYGFFEQPDVGRLLRDARAGGLDVDLDTVTYVLGSEVLLVTDRPGMARWRERVFRFMARNAYRAHEFFGIPADRVLQVGTLLEL